MTDESRERWITVGRVNSPFGVRGELRLSLFTESPGTEILKNSVHCRLVLSEKPPHVCRLISRRRHGRGAVVRLEGIETPEEARLFLGAQIQIRRDDLPEIGLEEYYWSDLQQCHVVTEEGVLLGEVAQIFTTGANDVLVVRHRELRNGRRVKEEKLLPFTRDVVRYVNLDRNEIIVRLMEGLP